MHTFTHLSIHPDHNRLRHLPETFRKLTTLATIRLSYNHLNELLPHNLNLTLTLPQPETLYPALHKRNPHPCPDSPPRVTQTQR